MESEKNLESTPMLEAKWLVLKTLDAISNKNYKEGLKLIHQALKLFIDEKSEENISISLSIKGYLEYFCDKNYYITALTNLNDAKNLANLLKSKTALLINEYFTGNLNLVEGNLHVALLHFEEAKTYAQKDDEFSFLNAINNKINQIKTGTTYNLPKKTDPLLALVKIGQAVAAETSLETLLKVIAEETKAAIQADRCTVFLYDKKNNELWSKVALGMDSQEIRFPADKGLAGHVVKTGHTINIKDAYNDERFNKDIDQKTGYHTKTILCMPIKNLNQEIIGAFQVLNKLNGEFTSEDESLLVAIGSSAGISLENAQLFEKQQEMYKEQKEVFNSFIDTLAASIDARDKITSGHSSRVRMYSSLIAKAFNLSEKEVQIIEKAATLHDIGKIGIRDAVLQKDGKLTDEEYKHIQEHAKITHDILEKIHMSEEFKQVTDIACSHHEKINGMGYYRHLKGDEIPFGGKILAVSDVFDAITSKRHYRDKMPIANVIGILLKDSGSHFEKEIVDKFLSIPLDKIVDVFLTENHLPFDKKDRKKLSEYCLIDIFTMLQKEDIQPDEKEILDTFNFYYANHTTKLEGNNENEK